MGFFGMFRRNDEVVAPDLPSQPTEVCDVEMQSGPIELGEPDETLTVLIHKDKAGKWRISIVDRGGKTLMVRSGFGFADWYDARRYAGRIAAARLEIETDGE